jgi:hypothetical protein
LYGTHRENPSVDSEKLIGFSFLEAGGFTSPRHANIEVLDGDFNLLPVVDVRRGVFNLSARRAHCTKQIPPTGTSMNVVTRIYSFKVECSRSCVASGFAGGV